MTRRDKFWMWLASLLPRELVYWATIRCAAHATTGKYSDTVTPSVNIIQMLERWRGSMSEDYTYPPTPRMVRAEELDAMRARAEAAERERDAWQRNAAMWHDKAEAAEAALRVVDTYASYYYDARQCYECGGERQPLEFAEWSQRLQGLIDLLENTEVQP